MRLYRVCVQINNEEFNFFNAFPFYFIIGLGVMRSTGNMSSVINRSVVWCFDSGPAQVVGLL